MFSDLWFMLRYALVVAAVMLLPLINSGRAEPDIESLNQVGLRILQQFEDSFRSSSTALGVRV
jgi:hypothetical protein